MPSSPTPEDNATKNKYTKTERREKRERAELARSRAKKWSEERAKRRSELGEFRNFENQGSVQTSQRSNVVIPKPFRERQIPQSTISSAHLQEVPDLDRAVLKQVLEHYRSQILELQHIADRLEKYLQHDD